MSLPILVVGATGNVGSHLVPALTASGAEVRGLAHSEDAAAQIKRAGAEPVAGDLTDPSSLGPAFQGVEIAHLITRGLENQVEMARNAIEAAGAAGVRRLVRQSAFVPEPAHETILGRQHAEIDSLIAASGIPATFLRPTFFMQNLLGGTSTVASDGVIYLPFGVGRAGIIDVRDVVECSVVACLNDEHAGETYTLTGPESIGIKEVAAALTQVLGKDVAYVDVPVEAGVQALVGMGMPPFMAETYGELFVNFAADGGDRITGDVEALTGHAARSIEDFARDFADMFRG